MNGLSSVRDPRGISWPDRSRWIAYLQFMLVFYVIFFPVFFGKLYLVPPDHPVLHLYFDWETRIPLVPWMIWPYLTLFTLFAVPVVQMNSGEMRRLTMQSTVCLITAGVCFLAIPCRKGFPPVEIDGLHRPVFEVLWTVDTPLNLVPSLHIAFSAIILLGARQVAIAQLRVFYLAWLALVSCSVVLVHQHHIVDVVTGLALAAVARAAFPLESRLSADKAPANEPAGYKPD